MRIPLLLRAAGAIMLGGASVVSVLPTTEACAGTTSSGAKSDGPVVIELFTSQGCSSCPPADKLAAKLAQDPALLVLSRPVTYWDRLGWKDTLGREANTTLQRGYAAKGNEGAGVYTPQMVVNGRHGAVRSNERKVRSLVRDAAMGRYPSISSSRLEKGSVRVTIQGNFSGPVELMLVAYSSHEDVKIARGENGGRVVSYTNVVIDERRIAEPTAANQTFTILPAKMRITGADRYAVILRRPDAGAILAGQVIKVAT